MGTEKNRPLSKVHPREGRRPRGDCRNPLWPAPSQTWIPEVPLRCPQASLPFVRGRQGLPEKGSPREPASPARSPWVPVGLSNAKGGRRTRRPGEGPPRKSWGLCTCCALLLDLVSPMSHDSLPQFISVSTARSSLTLLPSERSRDGGWGQAGRPEPPWDAEGPVRSWGPTPSRCSWLRHHRLRPWASPWQPPLSLLRTKSGFA